jgi:anti-sigma regulatory factor (Ser/Thr protein kinase)
VAEMTGDASVIAVDRLWPGDIADCRGDLLDVVFGWADFATLRRLVAKSCVAAGLTGSRLDDFVLAVHEISANAIVHAGAGGRLILRRVAHGIRCLIADTRTKAPLSCPAPRSAEAREFSAPDDGGEAADSGRGLWLAATLADELSITAGPESTVVCLYMRLD